MAIETKYLAEELKAIKEELHFIRQHIIDIDLVLTDRDINSFEDAERDLRNCKTKRLI